FLGWIWAGKDQIRNNTTVRIVKPLIFLPITVVLFPVVSLISLRLASNITFLTIIILISSFVGRYLEWWIKLKKMRKTGKTVVLFILFFGILFSITGWVFTKKAGEHSGDEMHYLVIARSIYEDHDLDVRNNMQTALEKWGVPRHVSINSRNGQMYSAHPIGLPLVLAPTIGMGLWARHLVLGVIAGLGCGGMLVLCLVAGASMRSSMSVTTLFSFSMLWFVYSARALPEILGTTIILWFHVCILAQKHRPWLTTAGAALCCCALPLIHTRLIPVALMGFGLFGLMGLMTNQLFIKKVIRLTVFTIAVFAGSFIYYSIMNSMYVDATSYPVKDLLFSYPVGMWQTLGSIRGILFSAPGFAWMLSASIVCLVRYPKAREASGIALLQTGVLLATSCATIWFAGGETLPGRFLLPAVALLIVPTAVIFQNTTSQNRWWFVFLAMISTIPLLLMFFNLSAFHESFSYATRVFHKVFPRLQGLIHPLQRPLPGVWLHPFAILLYASTVLMLFFKSQIRFQKILPLFVLLGLVVLPGTPQPAMKPSQLSVRNAEALISMEDRLENVFVTGETKASRVSLINTADLFAGTDTSVTLTTKPLTGKEQGKQISLQELPSNGWDLPETRWATLIKPFPAGKGMRHFIIRGKISGGAVPVLALREGNHTHLKKELCRGKDGLVSFDCAVRCGNAGDIYVLLALKNGNGAFEVESISWIPYSKALLAGTGMKFRQSDI
nr:hypothetical protein [PVC group bacterium]